MKLQDHLHYSDFKNESLQQKQYQFFCQKKVDVEEKSNGSNVG